MTTMHRRYDEQFVLEVREGDKIVVFGTKIGNPFRSTARALTARARAQRRFPNARVTIKRIRPEPPE